MQANKPWASVRSMRSRGETGSHRGRGAAPRLRKDDSVDRLATDLGNILSVSRSSGVDKGGDALKSLDTQDRYREFIQAKVDEYWKRYQCGKRLSDVDKRQKAEVEGNIMILFRKLREGIASTERRDRFALEVYETSLYLSIIFSLPSQTNTISSHLLPCLPVYRSIDPPSGASVLLSLVDALVSSYPSQQLYSDRLNSITVESFITDSVRLWIRDVTRCLRRHEYRRLGELTRSPTIDDLVHSVIPSPQDAGSSYILVDASVPSQHNLVRVALQDLLSHLQAKARTTAWRVLRSAYRELKIPVLDTRIWLAAELLLDNNAEDGGDPVDAWLSQAESNGEVERKEGAEGQWLIKAKR